MGPVGKVRSWYFVRIIFQCAGWKGSGDLLYNNMYVGDNTELHVWEAEFYGVFFFIEKHTFHILIYTSYTSCKLRCRNRKN